jgi:hypothetical protein
MLIYAFAYFAPFSPPLIESYPKGSLLLLSFVLTNEEKNPEKL